MFGTRRPIPEGLVVTRGSYRAKSPRFGADGGDACVRHYLLEEVVLVLISVSEFLVKTFVRCGLGSSDAQRRSPSLLRALPWSLGVLGCTVAVCVDLHVFYVGSVVACVLRDPIILGSAL